MKIKTPTHRFTGFFITSEIIILNHITKGYNV